MELAVCAIVLFLASSPVMATPHGYGVKNGAAAQAVAGAAAGAFSGAAGLPIALPHGAGFSGSYSKSASSSFASSSASSSSSSFSFSGSGIQGPVGGCTSGTCQNGAANGRVPNGNVNGYFSNNGANALASAQAGAFAGSQSVNKGSTPLCSGSSCASENGANCKGPHCNGVPSPDNKCEFGKCESPSSEPSNYDKESKDKCTSGICQNGATNGRVPNGNVNGYFSNNGANALAGSQAGAFAGSQPVNKGSTPLCSGSNCPNENGADCKGPHCNDVSSPNNKCNFGKCESPSLEPSNYDKESKDKCTSGQCNTNSGLSEVQDNSANAKNNFNSDAGSDCISGNCGTTSPDAVSPSNSYPSNNCATGQCGPSSSAAIPYGGNSDSNKPDEKCASGQCNPSSGIGREPPAFNGNKYPNVPKETCSTGECGPSPDTANYGWDSLPDNSHERCKSGQCGPTLNTGTPPSAFVNNGKPYNPNNKCTTEQCKSSPTDSEKCISGQCQPTSNGVTSPSGHDNSYDIPINIAGSTSGKPSYNLGNKPGPTTQSIPGCSFGNCGIFPSSDSTPSYAYSTTANTYSRPNYSPEKPVDCDSPDCSNGAYYPHASAPTGSSIPSYNKPVTYLTAPKQEPSCTSPNCQSPGASPGYYPSGSITPASGVNPTLPSNTENFPCSNGNCGHGHTLPPSPGSHSVPFNPNKLDPFLRPSGTKCSTPNCDSNTSHLPSNNPQTFGSSQDLPYSSSYKPTNIPQVTTIRTTPPHGYNTESNLSPNGPYNYPSAQPIPQNSVTGYKPTQPQVPTAFPSYSSNQPTSSPSALGPNNKKDDDSIPPFIALTPPKSSNCGGSPCPGNSVSTYPSGPSRHPVPSTGFNHPGTYNTGVLNAGDKNPEKPYLGGFGAPSGLLKPNDYTIPSIIPTNGQSTAATVADHTVHCTTGNCNTQPQYGQSGAGIATGKPLGTHKPSSCSTGNCGLQNGQSGTFNLNGANSAAFASANAEAVAYSGGFGGPPGLLKPFDDGKLTGGSKGLNGESPIPTSGAQSVGSNGALSGAGAHAAAVAGASAGAFGGSSYNHGANGGHGATGGCGGGCNGGHPKGGYHDEVYGGHSGAGAAAKSISFGNSFASAHASAGAATKGGYVR